MSFLLQISYEAEEINHHPEIFNCYNRVSLSLNTHDAGGKVTEKKISFWPLRLIPLAKGKSPFFVFSRFTRSTRQRAGVFGDLINFSQAGQLCLQVRSNFLIAFFAV